MAFTRSAWNDVIASVNAVLQNPPADTDCEALPTIDEVGPGTIWRKSHIQEVQDALKATCPSITFGTIPDLWKQSIIDEINNALGQAWCDCEPECDPDDLIGVDGTRFSLGELPMVYRNTCLGNLPAPTTFLADLITGIQIAPAGFEGLLWRFLANQTSGNITNYAEHAGDSGFSLFGLDQSDLRLISTGNIGCDGKVEVIGTGPLVPLSGGQNSSCGPFACGSPQCNNIISLGQANVASAIPILYVLEVVVTSGAGCC